MIKQIIKKELANQIDKLNSINSLKEYLDFSVMFFLDICEKNDIDIYNSLGNKFKKYLLNKYKNDYVYDLYAEMMQFSISEILRLDKIFYDPTNCINKYKKNYSNFIGVYGAMKPVFKLNDKYSICIGDTNNINENVVNFVIDLLNIPMTFNEVGYTVITNKRVEIQYFKFPLKGFLNCDYTISEKEMKLFNNFINILNQKKTIEIPSFKITAIYEDMYEFVFTDNLIDYFEIGFSNEEEKRKVYLLLRCIFGKDFIKRMLLNVI